MKGWAFASCVVGLAVGGFVGHEAGYRVGYQGSFYNRNQLEEQIGRQKNIAAELRQQLAARQPVDVSGRVERLSWENEGIFIRIEDGFRYGNDVVRDYRIRGSPAELEALLPLGYGDSIAFPAKGKIDKNREGMIDATDVRKIREQRVATVLKDAIGYHPAHGWFYTIEVTVPDGKRTLVIEACEDEIKRLDAAIGPGSRIRLSDSISLGSPNTSYAVGPYGWTSIWPFR